MDLASTRLRADAGAAFADEERGFRTLGVRQQPQEAAMLLPTPKWLDTGSNAWQMAAATFVGLQSVPGLVVLYGGIVKRKWAINSAFMAIYAFAAVLLVWLLWA